MCPLFAFLDPSPVTLLILGVIAVLLFGDRLPRVVRAAGMGLMEFRRGMRNVQREIEGAIESVASSVPIDRSKQQSERDDAVGPTYGPPSS
jgi:sec-independent protein translocase protein TatA